MNRRIGFRWGCRRIWLVASAVMCSCCVASCGPPALRGGPRADSTFLDPYEASLNYLFHKRLLPEAALGHDLPNVLVLDRLTCIPLDARDLNARGEVDSLARADGYILSPSRMPAIPCSERPEPRMTALSTTNSKRVMVLFANIDSTTFSPLRLVFSVVYDNRWMRDDYNGQDDADYYSFTTVHDPQGVVLGHFGGLMDAR